MNKEITLGIIRHLLTFGGGIIGSKGLADGEEITAAISGLVAVIGFAWSVLAKKKAKGATPVAG